jgi:hypothetical protein
MKKVFSIKETKMDEAEVTIGQFFITLLHSSTNAHILHLQSRSLSEHMALGEFYLSIEELTDNLIEAWQGKNSQLAQYPNTYMPPMENGLAELQELSAFVQLNRGVVGTDSEYKLTFLK